MSNKARILFVDDEKRVLNSMRGLFRREFELFLTTTGVDAIKIASENSIDVVVADQRMPGMTGIEVLGKVKQLSPNTIRILLTGYADPEAVEGSINIGEVFRFLSKPCSPKILRDTLKLAVAASKSAVTPGPETSLLKPDAVAAAPVTAVSPPQTANISEYSAVRRQQDPMVPPTLTPIAPNQRLRRPEIRHETPHSGSIPEDPLPPARSVTASSGDRLTLVPTGALSKHPESTVATTQGPSQGSATTPVRRDDSASHWQNSTSIVLSGDTSQEFRAPNFASGSRSRFERVGVIFFTVDPTFAESALRAASGDRIVSLATTLAKVAETLERKEAGVLVTDFTANRSVLQRMISALKQLLPELVTIVASDGRDTTDMIGLINHGQVFRYILKPIEPKKLIYEINAAAIKHLELVDRPALARRHEVIDMARGRTSDKPLNKFVTRIRNFRAGQADPPDSSS